MADWGPSSVFSRGLIYDPGTGVTTRLGLGDRDTSMDSWGHSVVLLSDGRVLMAGGLFGDATFTNTSGALFDPQTRTFTPTQDTNTSYEGSALTLMPNGEVLMVGAWNSTRVDVFDPATLGWRTEGFLNLGRDSGRSATLLRNGDVLVVGANTAEIYHRP